MGVSDSKEDSEFYEDLSEIFCFMGQTTSTGQVKGKKVQAAKLDTAGKTGVLNLSDMDLKPSSSVWGKLMNEGLNTKIKVLNISGNTIKSLPVEVFSLSNLKTMQVSRCSVQRIADMTPLDKLQQLDMDQNDLEVDLLGPLPGSLVKLDLSTNHFSAIPPSITILVNLVELNLAHNRIESTVGIGALGLLVDLNLDNNYICELSEDMSGLTKLRRISLQNNRIAKKAVSRDGQSIPFDFLVRTSVDTINLTGNTGLRKSEVMNFEGIEIFMERRKKVKDKQFHGGALTDMNLFGIE